MLQINSENWQKPHCCLTAAHNSLEDATHRTHSTSNRSKPTKLYNRRSSARKIASKHFQQEDGSDTKNGPSLISKYSEYHYIDV